ncbi:hypothetical protein [Bacillus sp. FJAT-45350]|uniref:hypothetical protein n=1 Tax=Bacillus sp. FJAT-45350 TaxID=2011014 RepID=UPI00211B7411|nr:hypothetical protein [Bacillus sp. FJAT-45350]
MSDVNEYRAKKEGRITPKMLVEMLKKELESGDVESIAYVYKKKDGTVVAGWTDMFHTEVVGLYEIAKLQAIDDMYSEDED